MDIRYDILERIYTDDTSLLVDWWLPWFRNAGAFPTGASFFHILVFF